MTKPAQNRVYKFCRDYYICRHVLLCRKSLSTMVVEIVDLKDWAASYKCSQIVDIHHLYISQQFVDLILGVMCLQKVECVYKM